MRKHRKSNTTSPALRFAPFVWRSVACQMTTYLICGLIFSNLFNYKELFGSQGLASFMRPTEDPLTALGPFYQIIRGLLLGVVLYPVWRSIHHQRHAWATIWLLFLGLAIFGVCGPAPGSLEGFFYTTIPFRTQLLGLPELIVQTLLFSICLAHWNKHPKRAYNTIGLIAVGLIALLSGGGYLALRAGIAPQF